MKIVHDRLYPPKRTVKVEDIPHGTVFAAEHTLGDYYPGPFLRVFGGIVELPTGKTWKCAEGGSGWVEVAGYEELDATLTIKPAALGK